MTDTSISSSVTEEAVDAAMFGDDPTPDVSEVADEPASSSETVEVAPEADTEDTHETDETPDGDEPAAEPDEEEPTVDPDPGKVEDAQIKEPGEPPLDWKTAPEQFREKYEATKTRLKEIESNSLQEKFFTGPETFLEELSELSPAQFQHTTQEIVRRGIEAQPVEFAEYLAATQPDAIAKTLSKLSPDVLAQSLFGPDVDAAKAKKIVAQVIAQDLEDYIDSGDYTEPTPSEAPATSAEAKPMSPEDIEKIVEKRLAEATKPQQIEKLEQQTYADIMAPVEERLAEAGLTPVATDSAEDKAYKEKVSRIIMRETFEHLFSDEKNAPKAATMMQLIKDLDEKGVKHLASTAKIIAEDYAGELIEQLTAKRAAEKTKPGTKPKPAPKVVKTGGAVPSFGNSSVPTGGRISDISESDFERAGM
jgi:hypothetical protein